MSAVDVCFPVRGERVRLDHGYALYGAITRTVPTLHRTGWLGVHPLSGMPAADVLLLRRSAELRLRVPVEHIAELLPLAGKALDVAGDTLQLGVPRLVALTPAPSLDARLVAVKLTLVPRRAETEPAVAPLAAPAVAPLDVAAVEARYRTELARQLEALGIQRPFDLCGRGRLTVAGRRVVGYTVRVRDLAPDESLRLQEAGLGGKRAMGCGIFRPTRGPHRG